MKTTDFNTIVQAQLSQCEFTLIGKGYEYAPDANSDTSADRLAHFKKAAALMGTVPKAALLGMLAKHIISVSDMCMSIDLYPDEVWCEKITDCINYLLILRALVKEENGNE